MVEVSPGFPRAETATLPPKNIIPRNEASKNPDTATHIRPEIRMDKHSPEAIKAKKIQKKPVPAFWRERAEFLPSTVAFLTSCGIDPQLVNPTPMGEGLTHVVFAYQAPDGTDKVIKMPREVRKGFMSTGYKDDAENIALVHKFFGGYAVPTEIRQDPKTGKYLFVQDAVKGKAITNNLETQSIRAQLVDLARLNREMMRQTGHSLDFIGVPGFLTWLRHQFRGILTKKSSFDLSNILIDESGKLKIIDDGLLRFRDVPLKQKIVSHGGFFFNRLIMRFYFGVSLRPPITG